MGSKTQHLEITRKLDRARIRSQIGSRYTLGPAEQANITRVYCDTFDWRLYRDDAVFVFEPENHKAALVHLPSDDEIAAAPMDVVARFPVDLPEGVLRTRLAKLVKLRALLPLAKVKVTAYSFPLLDRDDKTVARLVVEHLRLARGNRSRKLPSVARVAAVTGYGKAAQRLQRVVARCPGVRPAQSTVFAIALAALDQEPGAHRGGKPALLEPEMRADIATRTVLLSYLDTIEDNQDGVRNDIDSEFLHDLRVAVRRTRTLIGRVRGVFPAAAVERFSVDFKWLGDATSTTRDLDVYLLGFDDYRRSIVPSMRPDLEPLREFLRRRRHRALAELVQVLAAPRYRKLLRDWRNFLTTAELDEPGASAERPIAGVAGEEIRRIYRKVLRDGRAIGSKSPAVAMHDLRKDAKKLRYLIEAFGSLYDPEAVARMNEVLKRLQDNLGTFNDLDVQSEAMRGFATAMLDEGASPQTLLAMGVLIGHFEERSRETRKRFARRFAEFSRAKNVRVAKSIFHKEVEGE